MTIPGNYANRLILVDFWATWCAPCRAELPHVKAVRERFGEEVVAIVGVSLDSSADGLAKFTADEGMTWTQIHDKDRRLAGAFGVEAIPAFFLVDGTTGRVLASGDDLRGALMLTTVEKRVAARTR